MSATSGDPSTTTIMWEARAADGRLDDLVAWAIAHSSFAAQVFRADHGDLRVVVIDPSGAGLVEPPEQLVARPPHAWGFTPVPR